MFFPDTTVLINFGIICRYDILEHLTQGNGKWCATVSDECADWTTSVPAVTQAWDVFGEPVRPTPLENTNAGILRQTMVKPGDLTDRPHKHLGEAETITILVSRGWATGSYFLTDDVDAAERARTDGIRSVTTWDLLKLAHRATKDGDLLLNDNDAWVAVQELERHDRRRWPCPPCSKGRAVFLAWLKR